MIRQWQEIIYRGQLPLGPPDGARLPQAQRGVRDPGMEGERHPTRWTASSGRRRPLTARRWIWFEIAEEQNVFPMMPAGKGLSDLIEKWGGPDE